jgi:hypothetical protein
MNPSPAVTTLASREVYRNHWMRVRAAGAGRVHPDYPVAAMVLPRKCAVTSLAQNSCQCKAGLARRG